MSFFKKILKVILILGVFGIGIFLYFGFSLFSQLFGNPFYESKAEVLNYNGEPTEYYQMGKKVYYKYYEPGSISIVYKFLDDVDINTFEVLGGKYAKDSSNVYIAGNKTNIDSNSLKILSGGCYILDKNNVYKEGKSISQDIQNFELVGDGKLCVARDSNFVYVGNLKIEGADPDTFKIIQHQLYKDYKNVYYGDGRPRVMEGVDPNTFEILTNQWMRDKDNIIVGNTIVEELKPNNIKRVYKFSAQHQKEYLDSWLISIGGKIYKKINLEPYYEEVQMQEDFILRDL